uniref:Uncharacterized protein n=1 Tax=Branchiostoma floridae TaxID=7739 RepID=C3YYA2_BRAFL|eukprot:XP_002598709.1 hypothetical protein BRAFLDRAFT_95827 [Branchiostoma floridae]
MGGKLRHLLIFLLIIMKELNVPEAGCSCEPSSPCRCTSMGLTSIPQNLPTSISMLDLDGAGSGHDSNLIGQDQPQAITEANFNTTATVVASVHGQPGQGQYQATTKSLVVKNPVYGPEPTAFKLSHLYNAECQGNSQADP